MTVNVKSDGATCARFDHKDGAILRIPSSIHAHDAVSGCVGFYLPDQLLASAKIEGYILKLVDTHDNAVCIEPILLHERRDAP